MHNHNREKFYETDNYENDFSGFDFDPFESIFEASFAKQREKQKKRDIQVNYDITIGIDIEYYSTQNYVYGGY